MKSRTDGEDNKDLKTLKDIEILVDVDRKDLRLEAIKWIQYLINEIENHCHKEYNVENIVKEKYFTNCIQCRDNFVRVQWIKHFFNITEEDLKEMKNEIEEN